MTQAHELERSRKIIEIGAMAVVRWPTIDPQLCQATTEEITNDSVLSQLGEVERHLQEHNGCQKVLDACAVIRDTLLGCPARHNVSSKRWPQSIPSRSAKLTSENVEISALKKQSPDGGEDSEIPSNVLSAQECGIFGGLDNDCDLMVILARRTALLGTLAWITCGSCISKAL